MADIENIPDYLLEFQKEVGCVLVHIPVRKPGFNHVIFLWTIIFFAIMCFCGGSIYLLLTNLFT